MSRRRQRGFVRAVCFLLAALLLVLTLRTQILLWNTENEIAALKEEKSELEREKRILSVRMAERLSLDEIARRAEEELGMRRCRGDQITELGIEEEDAEYK
jgi:type II secretory pathway component PulL